MKALVLVMLFLFQCSILCAKPVQVGTTYSPQQSEYLGTDWKKTYISILNIGFDLIRLGAYWSEIEREKDVYDFSALDWQVWQARKRGVPVVLTVGMKAPRWPEYYIPEWILKGERLPFAADVSKNEYLRKRTLKFIEKTVNRYKNDPIIYAWQVENEALNRIGEKYWFIGRSFLKQEVALVRKLDEGKRPILLTTATYPNKILRFIAHISVWQDPVKECLEIGDILGLNVYPVVGQKIWGKDFYFRTSRKTRKEYFSRLLDIVKNKGKEAWVVELQAEPWEPGQLVYKEKEKPYTSAPEETVEVFKEFRALGVNTILLWGAEYWYFRKVRYRDVEWERTVLDILREKGIINMYMGKGKLADAK